MKDKITEWLFYILSGLLIPCIVTMICSEMPEKREVKESGISIIMENGEKIDMEEFLVYMIAGQISLHSEKEALKVQAVIARTNLMRELNGKKEGKAKDLKLSYLKPEDLEESFGKEKREQIYRILYQAVHDTERKTLRYDQEYIDALYHEVSIGNTVSSEEMYGRGRPYLISVSSSQDVESEEYMKISEWKPKEVYEKLASVKKTGGKKADQILSAVHIKEKTENGYIKTVAVGTAALTGVEWQKLFSLPSSNFYLEEMDGLLRMITLGKGHGVGLSQYGANALAKEGWTYDKILKKYYPGAILEKCE